MYGPTTTWLLRAAVLFGPFLSVVVGRNMAHAAGRRKSRAKHGSVPQVAVVPELLPSADGDIIPASLRTVHDEKTFQLDDILNWLALHKTFVTSRGYFTLEPEPGKLAAGEEPTLIYYANNHKFGTRQRFVVHQLSAEEREALFLVPPPVVGSGDIETAGFSTDASGSVALGSQTPSAGSAQSGNVEMASAAGGSGLGGGSVVSGSALGGSGSGSGSMGSGSGSAGSVGSSAVEQVPLSMSEPIYYRPTTFPKAQGLGCGISLPEEMGKRTRERIMRPLWDMRDKTVQDAIRFASSTSHNATALVSQVIRDVAHWEVSAELIPGLCKKLVRARLKAQPDATPAFADELIRKCSAGATQVSNSVKAAPVVLAAMATEGAVLASESEVEARRAGVDAVQEAYRNAVESTADVARVKQAATKAFNFAAHWLRYGHDAIQHEIEDSAQKTAHAVSNKIAKRVGGLWVLGQVAKQARTHTRAVLSEPVREIAEQIGQHAVEELWTLDELDGHVPLPVIKYPPGSSSDKKAGDKPQIVPGSSLAVGSSGQSPAGFLQLSDNSTVDFAHLPLLSRRRTTEARLPFGATSLQSALAVEQLGQGLLAASGFSGNHNAGDVRDEVGNLEHLEDAVPLSMHEARTKTSRGQNENRIKSISSMRKVKKDDKAFISGGAKTGSAPPEGDKDEQESEDVKLSGNEHDLSRPEPDAGRDVDNAVLKRNSYTGLSGSEMPVLQVSPLASTTAESASVPLQTGSVAPLAGSTAVAGSEMKVSSVAGGPPCPAFNMPAFDDGRWLQRDTILNYRGEASSEEGTATASVLGSSDDAADAADSHGTTDLVGGSPASPPGAIGNAVPIAQGVRAWRLIDGGYAFRYQQVPGLLVRFFDGREEYLWGGRMYARRTPLKIEFWNLESGGWDRYAAEMLDGERVFQAKDVLTVEERPGVSVNAHWCEPNRSVSKTAAGVEYTDYVSGRRVFRSDDLDFTSVVSPASATGGAPQETIKSRALADGQSGTLTRVTPKTTEYVYPDESLSVDKSTMTVRRTLRLQAGSR
ncbi:unnamed protein product [Amoebophrya sp. A25]|nr:unnamed protein product [Amoebophrya sp. A25]|eukprot:GSA25T00012269001.1